MYHAHFGLERDLFGEGIAADAAFFRVAKHDRLIAHFKLALATPSSAIVLHGPAGVGKTTLMSTALRAISTRLALAWVGGMATNTPELLELLLVELGINTSRTTRIERLQLWRQLQSETRATDSRLIVVVERTEDLQPDVLHALDQLTAPDPVGNPGANLVLLGHSSIHEHLAAPVLDSLRQRIRLRAELEPFTETELQEYLRQKVVAAGGQYDRLFAPGAVAALHRYSNGVARLANTLCESALDIAAIQEQKQLTGELVAKTAVTLLGLAEPAPAMQPAAAAVPRAPVKDVEAHAAPPPAAAPATAPVAERRAEPRAPAPLASAIPPDARLAPQAPAAAAMAPAPPRPAPQAPAPAVKAPAPPRPAPQAPPPAAIAAAPPPPSPVEFDYDGSVTDVADVGITDFPILTDAFEEYTPEPPAARPAAPIPAKVSAPMRASSAPPAAKTSAAASPAAGAPPQGRAAPTPAATRPAARPAPRVETSSPPPRTAAKPVSPAPTTTPVPHAAVAKQPPAGRAIADAKSIDDLSQLDAETLFADAEFDLVSAALASSEWLEDEEPTEPSKALPPRSTPAAPAKSRSAPAKPAASSEDAYDIFGLDNNAPLELIDDSTLPPASPRKSTAR